MSSFEFSWERFWIAIAALWNTDRGEARQLLTARLGTASAESADAVRAMVAGVNIETPWNMQPLTAEELAEGRGE